LYVALTILKILANERLSYVYLRQLVARRGRHIDFTRTWGIIRGARPHELTFIYINQAIIMRAVSEKILPPQPIPHIPNRFRTS